MTLDPKQLVFLAVVAVLTGLFVIYRRKIVEWLLENRWGGGPRPPSHPLPSNDATILRRKRRATVVQS